MDHKWNKIRNRIASDEAGARRVYERFRREIQAAARRGDADSDAFRSLKGVLARAQTYQVPRDMIDRAIEDARSGTERYEEIRCEGFGPDGAMIIVEALTDQAERTIAGVRDVFEQNGISWSESESAACMFDAMGVIGQTDLSYEDVYKLHIEEQVNSFYILEDEDAVVSLCNAEAFAVMEQALRNAGVSAFAVVEQTMEPQDYITLPADAKAPFARMIRDLEDLKDVLQVYHNVDLDAEDEEEEAIEPPFTLSDEERGLFSTIMNAIGQVNRYAYQGSMSMTGSDYELTMMLEGDINLKPEFALHAKSSFQSGGMDVEQETIAVQDKLYSTNNLAGEWTVSDGVGGAPDNLTAYFSDANAEAAEEVRVAASGDVIHVEIRYNPSKIDKLALQHRPSSTTIAAQHRFRIDAATMLPASAVLEIESDDGNGFVSMRNEFIYTYHETAKEIVPPIGVTEMLDAAGND
ncbi:YebC/PmpR family DNA-binding transcriptional regulator [Paenibacillus methanolicus]|uniref:Probable transcriptional regulatory protein BCM02_107150 n=1 Tax=Paenibacillus methanolicus TaxID=582686 RepID=A0A5S5C419_9BACL|nr:YebC/PmpR family DNA-binding transcriptional regulator [Paenibacillus methanolicus]TYP73166.1 YebC/PmpR family DNA-binding regulatory protein [Paenibacillus methanolicus]